MPVEGTFRAHQVPLADLATNPEHLAQLEAWMRSYRPEELFDDDGALARRARRARARRATRRMGANPHANGGLLLRDLELPDFRDYAVDVPTPGATDRSEATRVLGALPARRRSRANPRRNFRLFGPDETASNRLERRLRGDRPRLGRPRRLPSDDHLAPDGRVMEVLQRAPLPGLARGLPAHRPPRPLQLLRGVHPHRRLDVQPAREVAEGRRGDIPWRRPIASLNYLLTLARLAPGPQRLLATRTRASSTTSSTRRPRSSASTCRRTRTPCCRSPTTACAAATTST